MKNQDLKNETYIGEDGLLYCAKCHTPCEKVLPHPLDKGKLWKVHVMCQCEREAYEKDQAERAKREFEEMVSRNRMVCFHEKRLILRTIRILHWRRCRSRRSRQCRLKRRWHSP